MSGVTFKRQGRKDHARVLSFTSLNQKSKIQLTVKCSIKADDESLVLYKPLDNSAVPSDSGGFNQIQKRHGMNMTLSTNSTAIGFRATRNLSSSFSKPGNPAKDTTFFNETSAAFALNKTNSQRNHPDKSFNSTFRVRKEKSQVTIEPTTIDYTEFRRTQKIKTLAAKVKHQEQKHGRHQSEDLLQISKLAYNSINEVRELTNHLKKEFTQPGPSETQQGHRNNRRYKPSSLIPILDVNESKASQNYKIGVVSPSEDDNQKPPAATPNQPSIRTTSNLYSRKDFAISHQSSKHRSSVDSENKGNQNKPATFANLEQAEAKSTPNKYFSQGVMGIGHHAPVRAGYLLGKWELGSRTPSVPCLANPSIRSMKPPRQEIPVRNSSFNDFYDHVTPRQAIGSMTALETPRSPGRGGHAGSIVSEQSSPEPSDAGDYSILCVAPLSINDPRDAWPEGENGEVRVLLEENEPHGLRARGRGVDAFCIDLLNRKVRDVRRKPRFTDRKRKSFDERWQQKPKKIKVVIEKAKPESLPGIKLELIEEARDSPTNQLQVPYGDVRLSSFTPQPANIDFAGFGGLAALLGLGGPEQRQNIDEDYEYEVVDDSKSISAGSADSRRLNKHKLDDKTLGASFKAILSFLKKPFRAPKTETGITVRHQKKLLRKKIPQHVRENRIPFHTITREPRLIPTGKYRPFCRWFTDPRPNRHFSRTDREDALPNRVQCRGSLPSKRIQQLLATVYSKLYSKLEVPELDNRLLLPVAGRRTDEHTCRNWSIRT